jgi:multiple sugar transport system substrate-binding protein
MALGFMGQKLTRRELVRGGVFVAAGALVAACSPSQSQSPKTAPAQAPAQAPTQAPSSAKPTAAPNVQPTIAPAASSNSSNAKAKANIGWASVTTGGTGKDSELKMFKEFSEANPDISITFLERPGGGSQDYHDYLVTVFSAKDSTVDVASVDTGAQWPAEFAPAGWLDAIDDILPKDIQEKLMPQMVYQSTIKGKIYSWPWMNDVGVFYYRKDLLDQASKKAPDTWQEMVQTAQDLGKPPSMWGFIPCFRKDEQLSCNLQEYFWSNNGDMTDASGKITINKPPVVEAIQFAADLIKKYKVTPESVNSMQLDEGRQIFTEGKAIFHRNWAYVWTLAQGSESKIAGKIAMTVVPQFGPNGKHVTNLGGWSYVVSNFSKHKEESRKVIQWFGDAPHQLEKFLSGSGWPPAHQDAYKGDNLAKVPPNIREFMDPYYKISLTAHSRPRHPQYRQISEIIQNEAQAAILGQKTAQAAADAMAQQLAPLLQGWTP